MMFKSDKRNNGLPVHKVTVANNQHIISDAVLTEIIEFALNHIEFDEDWYLENYKDIKTAVDTGMIANAKDHFLHYGYFERRLPYRVPVDETFYLTKYPDVKKAIDNGAHKDVAEHFYRYGALEGRVPHEGFTLFPKNKPGR